MLSPSSEMRTTLYLELAYSGDWKRVSKNDMSCWALVLFPEAGKPVSVTNAIHDRLGCGFHLGVYLIKTENSN